MTGVTETWPRRLAITGLGVLSGAGVGPEALSTALAGNGPGPVAAAGIFEEEESLPRADGFVLTDFRARDYLGRKGTSHLDRSAALGMVACQAALADTDLVVDDENRARVGITLGTTSGSIKSTSDFSRDTFVEDRPYYVNPLVFPNAVMNGAAGQSAIRFGLRGVNATVAGGPLAIVNVLRYGRTMIGCGHVDALLAGSVEEYGPQAAWAVHYAQTTGGGDLPAGEGAAVLVLEDAQRVAEAGRRADAEMLAVELAGFDPAESDFRTALRGCLHRALERAEVDPGQVRMVATGGGGTALDQAEDAVADEVFGAEPERLRLKQATGEAASALGGLGLAALVTRHRQDQRLDGQVSVLTVLAEPAAVGAVVIRGWTRAGSDHR